VLAALVALSGAASAARGEAWQQKGRWLVAHGGNGREAAAASAAWRSRHQRVAYRGRENEAACRKVRQTLSTREEQHGDICKLDSMARRRA